MCHAVLPCRCPIFLAGALHVLRILLLKLWICEGFHCRLLRDMYEENRLPAMLCLLWALLHPCVCVAAFSTP